MAARPSLAQVLTALKKQHPTPQRPVSTDPFELVLWEQVAYLASDDVRLRAFEALRERVGLLPDHISASPLRTLMAVARIGGSIAVKERAERMKTSAALAGTLKDLATLPLQEARKRLAKFPMIGAPGADKVLLFAGIQGLARAAGTKEPVFALESNGLRVLLRLGFGTEGANYSASYRSVMEAIASSLPKAIDARIDLHQRLRQHGLLLCKRSKPLCSACSLATSCGFPRKALK